LNNQIYQHQYINLTKEIREFLVKLFEIPRTGISEILNEQVISDGVCNEDLKAITEEKMIEYTGSHETFGKLWDLTITKVQYEIAFPPEVVLPELEDAIKASEEKRPYCGACVSHHGRHSNDCITNNTIK
jgi:hypothetical protein